MATYNVPAPGDLEVVRALLNTWGIASATGRPADELPALLADAAFWAARLPSLPRPSGAAAAELTRLRDDLRLALAGGDTSARLNRWLARHPLVAVVGGGAEAPALRHAPGPAAGAIEHVLAAVADAIAAGSWSRLKICPGCGWVFYDRTRSRTKVWCDMLTGGDAGSRACGTIAKVGRYRARRRSEPR
jgi:predicted RNA-binding Zn ribbon-like protein